MGAKFYNRKKIITAALQYYHLKKTFPKWKHELKMDIINSIANIKPNPNTKEYKVLFHFQLYKAPSVRVISPKLEKNGDQEVPHLHRDGSLCLYFKQEFDSSMFLVDTIVPWTTLWLEYYEIWKATGKWLGGGIEH